MKRLLHVTSCAVAALGLTLGTLRAQQPTAPAPAAPAATETPAVPATATATETPAAKEETPTTPAATTTEAPKADAPLPAPTDSQRIYDLEQYIKNSKPGEETTKVKKEGSDVEEEVKTSWKSNLETTPGPGHNAWQMVSTALVLFMTLPGLALFYGGLVRRKNVLSVLAQCMGIAGLVTILWWAAGYSLSFSASGSGAIIGDLKQAFFADLDPAKSGAGYYWISDAMWAMFQLTFAIITPALIIGAIAERMKFSAVLLFVALWMFVVYFPLAHMVWSTTGFMSGGLNAAKAGIKALDFAGGTVVHMSSGWSALVLCLILGKRIGFGKENMAPHSMVLCMVGTGMLWVGWYGFNAGSALGADAIASNAFATTTLAAATAGFVWGMAEWVLRGHASVLGFCSGIVAGLVVVTPACGFVNYNGAMIIGVLAGIIPFLAVAYMKKLIGYDDALDTFGVHAVGGTLGALLTGILADGKVSPTAKATMDVIKEAGGSLVMEQIKAIGVTIILSVVATAVIAYAIKFTLGLRPTPEVESSGLDISEHGEEGYLL